MENSFQLLTDDERAVARRFFSDRNTKYKTHGTALERLALFESIYLAFSSYGEVYYFNFQKLINKRLK